MRQDKITLAGGLNFANQAAQTFASLLLIQVFSLGTGILSARFLGPEGKGSLALLILYPNLLFIVGHFSVFRALTVHVGLKKYSLEDYGGTCAGFAALATFVLAAVFLAILCFFPRLFSSGLDHRLIFLALGLLPCFFSMQLFSSLLQTQEKIAGMNLVSVVQGGTVFVFFVVFVIVLKARVAGAVWAYLAGNGLAAGLGIWGVASLTRGKWRFRGRLLAELVSDGLKLHLGVIGVYLFSRIDQLMLGYYREIAHLGFYSVAVSMSDALQLVPAAVQTVFYARVAQNLSNPEDMASKAVRILKHNFFILLAVASLLFLSARILIVLVFGEAFIESLKPLLVLLPGAFVLYLSVILTNFLVGVRRFLPVSFVMLGSALVNIFLNMWLIPAYGAVGAAWAGTATYFGVAVAELTLFLRYSGYSLARFFRECRFDREDFSFYAAFLKNLRFWRA